MTGPVLVTGATGFVGRHLVERLANDHEVVGWGRSSVGPERRGVTWNRLDLLDRDRVRGAVRALQPSAVYHCAGFPHVAESWSDPVGTLAANVRGTHHLLDALRRTSLRPRVLVAGSAAIYASSAAPIDEHHPLAPKSPYAVSKLAQEQLALQALDEDGLEIIVTRSFNHTGPYQTPAFFAPSVARQIALIESGREAPVVVTGNLDAHRDISDVRDVVAAYVALVARGRPGTVYNVASGVARSMQSVLDALLALTDVPVRTEVDPRRLRPHDIPFQLGDAGRLRHDTGWRPTIPFERCMSDLLDHWRREVRPKPQ